MEKTSLTILLVLGGRFYSSLFIQCYKKITMILMLFIILCRRSCDHRTSLHAATNFKERVNKNKIAYCVIPSSSSASLQVDSFFSLMLISSVPQ